MSLFLADGLVSARMMLRLLCALLIMILVFSHGTMGMAAPHHDGAAHMHIGQSAHDAGSHTDDDNHHDVDDDAADGTTTGDVDPASEQAPGPAHAHALGDQAPSAFAFPERLPGSIQLAAMRVNRLVSAALRPLLEPPSA